MASTYPSYLALHASGELQERIREAQGHCAPCDLCPRRCGVDRLAGKIGRCRAPSSLHVSSAGPHFGEEAPLVGHGGSGTIFLTFCSLGCVFCQNFDISHLGHGAPVTAGDLARQMVRLQGAGCRNINLVTPTHYLPRIMEALPLAIELGLEVPLVWNCGGYENPEALRLLEGVVDIYLPDFKFAQAGPAEAFCDAPDYPEAAMASLREMHRQVGDLVTDDQGAAIRGVMIRHLVMPGLPGNSRMVLEFIARDLSLDSYVNVMDQYHPAWKAADHPGIDRPLRPREHREAVDFARSLGLHRGLDD
jgi:putative pyruvate formate lyase activating enzyme